jgi:DNA processing protein
MEWISWNEAMNVDLHELLTLSTIAGIGPMRLIRLVSHFKDTHLVVTASPKELVRVEGIEKNLALDIARFFRGSCAGEGRRFADEQLSRANKANARIISFWDKQFPHNLKNIYDPPAFLYLRGTLAEEDRYSIAIVGSRVPTPYGMRMAGKFAQEFSRLGVTTISGLARGIDTIAHATTVKGGTRTLAVLGSGVDVIYPPENRELVEHIVDCGAVISEYRMGAKPDAPNFPKRNRIISGISLGTVIIETGVEGGAMITASMAFDQNREVFAIPFPADEKKKSGANLLIKQGKATLVEDAEDVIHLLAPQLKNLIPLTGAARTPPPALTIFEQQLYDSMGDAPIHIDALAARAGVPTADALVHLLSLEFKGVVRQTPGKMFLKTS